MVTGGNTCVNEIYLSTPIGMRRGSRIGFGAAASNDTYTDNSDTRASDGKGKGISQSNGVE